MCPTSQPEASAITDHRAGHSTTAESICLRILPLEASYTPFCAIEILPDATYFIIHWKQEQDPTRIPSPTLRRY